MELQNINKEEIEFFLKGESLAKVNLPEHSTEEIRTNLARGLNIKEYDRFTFLLNNIIRLDSNNSPYFKKEIILYNPDKYIEDIEDYSDNEMEKYINWNNSLNPAIENLEFENFQVMAFKDINIIEVNIED